MPSKKAKVAVLISGKGRLLRRLITLQESYEIVAVISNRRRALGLNHAREAAIPFYIFDKRDYASVAEQQEAMRKRLQQLAPDYICLAGFLQLLDSQIVRDFAGKIINIHPSLLPKLKGCFGVHCHELALQQGEKSHGCTMHLVDEKLDNGKIIAQASCAVSESDSPETLGQRVHELELQIYPWVLEQLVLGNIKIEAESPVFSDEARRSAKAKNFLLAE